MIDVETQLPWHCLDPSPWNSKKPIHGKYRKGVRASIDYFEMSDRLKVWPNPREPGRYYVLNGNQRLEILMEREIERLAVLKFGLQVDEATQRPDLAKFREAMDHPDHVKEVQSIRSQAAELMVDVQVMERLDREDAVLFTLMYDRNHAITDEARLVTVADRELPNRPRRLIDTLLRPDRAFVNPVVTPKSLPGGPPEQSPKREESAEFAKYPELPKSENPEKSAKSDETPDFVPTEEKPWGDPPPSREIPSNPSTNTNYSLIPRMFSLSPEAIKELDDGLLRTRARGIRQVRLLAAVKQLDEVLAEIDQTDESNFDDPIIELALLVMNRNMVAARNKRIKNEKH